MESVSLVKKALKFATLKHDGQKRKDKAQTPYIAHPLRVLELLETVAQVKDEEVLAAGLLHDTLEDTETTIAELDAEFGLRVRKFVQEVTDDKSLPQKERKRQQIEHASHLSPSAALIKIADKIANISDVINQPPTGWEKQRRLDYLNWAAEVVRSCPSVNEPLERMFFETLGAGTEMISREKKGGMD